jgi:hypothetical protein
VRIAAETPEAQLVTIGRSKVDTGLVERGAQLRREALILKPVGPGGGGQAPLPVYLRQPIARLNSIFGEATPLTDKVAFVNHIADIAREDANTMAQVANNRREVAMSGNIKGTVNQPSCGL